MSNSSPSCLVSSGFLRTVPSIPPVGFMVSVNSFTVSPVTGGTRKKHTDFSEEAKKDDFHKMVSSFDLPVKDGDFLVR